jgi:TolB protein
VIEADGNVYTINPDGTDRSFVDFTGVVNNAAVAWSPDSTRLALGVAGPIDGSSQLIISDAHGRNVQTIYEAPPIGVPFYLSWSPSGEHIAFLANRASGDGLSLRTIKASGDENAVLVANGSPSYFSWSPDGRRMLLHIGAEDGIIGMYTLGDTQVNQRNTAPGAFRAPAWSPTSEDYVFADSTGTFAGNLILVQGDRETIQTSYRGLISFNWSPDGTHVAYAISEDGFQYNQLSVYDVASGASQRLTQGDVIAFYWSPDSTRLAFLELRQGGDTSAQDRDVLISNPAQGGNTVDFLWNIADIDSQQNTRLASFLPSRHFGLTFAFFDQYAQSASYWSPDSRYLLLIGSPAGGESAVYRVDTLAGGADNIQRIGPGDYAVWSWK